MTKDKQQEQTNAKTNNADNNHSSKGYDRKHFSPDQETMDNLVLKYCGYASAAGLLPMPLIDLGVVTSIQLDLIRRIAKLYELDFDAVRTKAWVVALAGGTLPRLIGSGLKLIPGLGTYVGMSTSAVLSGASTFAIANVFIYHLENGGTVYNFEVSKLRYVYKQFFRQGKTVAQRIVKRQKAKKSGEHKATKKEQAQRKADVFSRIEELYELHKNGVINEEEFLALKKKLLRDLV